MKTILAAASLILAIQPASAALYQQDFEIDDTANWTTHPGPEGMDVAANYHFDYSTAGIPAAPGGSGTRGMKLQANLNSGIFGGMSASPVLSTPLPERYTLTFDWWANTVGPMPAGGSGSTNLSTFGVGTAGTSVQYPGLADSVWFGSTGEGGSSVDIRAYSSAATAAYADASTVYSAEGVGNRNNSHPYYSTFGDVAPPAAQTLLFPGQTGNTAVGTMAFQWHQVQIQRTADSVLWTVDGILMATVPVDGLTFGGTNIFFGHSDINATSSTDPNDAALLFTLIDNVQVVPEPGALGLLGLSLLPLLRRRR